MTLGQCWRRSRRTRLVIAVLIGAALVAACGKATLPSSTALDSRTISTAGVQLTIQPIRIDDSGAVFKLQLDTHTGSLDLDLMRTSKLEVGGRVWPVAAWSGDAPGGHHRSGELRFTRSGTTGGDATLTLSGLSTPVVVTWKVDSA